MRPVIPANDRVEWFFQMSDEVQRDCGDRTTGKSTPIARPLMLAGDTAAMPASCRPQGNRFERSIVLIAENVRPLVYEIRRAEAPEVPVQF